MSPNLIPEKVATPERLQKKNKYGFDILKYLHSIIAKVDHDDTAIRWQTDTARSVQFAGTLTWLAHLPQEVTVTLKHLDTIVAGVRHYYATFVVAYNALRKKQKQL